jgi:hypothetical protein
MESLIVPSAIQRIRSFLIEMSGMKVKPWATTEETLAALHTTLVARRGCDIFWVSLRGLLEALARDLKTRQEASPGTLVDNELLDSERYATLLDEIRAALARQTEEPASFRRLASALSAPALGLLLFLGGATSVGCDGTGLRAPAQAQDAGPAGAADAKVAQPDSTPDLPPTISIAPDARPVVDAMAPSQSDGAAVTIQDIMDSCNIPDQQQQQILTCLATLGASWAGLSEEFAGASCSLVDSDLNCFAMSRFCGGMYDMTISPDPNKPWICNPIIIYAGVRFV